MNTDVTESPASGLFDDQKYSVPRVGALASTLFRSRPGIKSDMRSESMRIDPLITKISKNPVNDHLALGVQVVIWVLLARSDSFPEWFYLICLAIIVGLLTMMHFLCQNSAKTAKTEKV